MDNKIKIMLIILVVGLIYYGFIKQREDFSGGVSSALMEFINWFSVTPNAISKLRTFLTNISFDSNDTITFAKNVNVNGATNVKDFGFNGGIWVNPTASWKTQVAFNQPVTFSEPTTFNGNATFKGSTNVDDFGLNKGIWVGSDVSWKNPVTFDQPIIFNGGTTFNQPAQFNGNVNAIGSTNVRDFGLNGGIWMNSAASLKTPIMGTPLSSINLDQGWNLKDFISSGTTIDSCTSDCLNHTETKVARGTEYVVFRPSDKRCWCKNNTGVLDDSTLVSRQIYK